jgi:hypothetical protein
VNIPSSGIVDYPGHNLYKLFEDRVYGSPEALAPIGRIPDHIEQVLITSRDCCSLATPGSKKRYPNGRLHPASETTFQGTLPASPKMERGHSTITRSPNELGLASPVRTHAQSHRADSPDMTKVHRRYRISLFALAVSKRLDGFCFRSTHPTGLTVCCMVSGYPKGT